MILKEINGVEYLSSRLSEVVFVAFLIEQKQKRKYLCVYYTWFKKKEGQIKKKASKKLLCLKVCLLFGVREVVLSIWVDSTTTASNTVTW